MDACGGNLGTCGGAANARVGPGRPGLGVRAADPRMPRSGPDRGFDPGHAVLAGLAEACGLRFRMTGLLPAGRSVADATGRLDLPLQNLIGVTQTAVAAAVLAHRT